MENKFINQETVKLCNIKLNEQVEFSYLSNQEKKIIIQDLINNMKFYYNKLNKKKLIIIILKK